MDVQTQPSSPVIDEPSWTEPFKRQVLACMLRRDLTVPTKAFGTATAMSPQQRIASVINKYREQYDQPTPEIIDELIRRELERLGPAERQAVQTEWVWVAETDLPDTLKFIEEQVGL